MKKRKKEINCVHKDAIEILIQKKESAEWEISEAKREIRLRSESIKKREEEIVNLGKAIDKLKESR